MKFISYADGKGHDCLGAVCTPLYGDPKMDCVCLPIQKKMYRTALTLFRISCSHHEPLRADGNELGLQVPKYIVEPDCSIFAHLKVSSNGRTLSDEASVNGK